MKRSLLLVLLSVACAAGLEPAEPVWGKESCAHCSMLVSERASAAQLLTADGARRFFDDAGCLVRFLDRTPSPGARAWVRLAGGWILATEARFAPARTPMDYGFVGAAEGVGWAELQQQVRARHEGPR